MKRTSVLALVIFVTAAVVGEAQIRDQVAIVKSVPYKDMTATFQRVAESAQKAGNTQLADVYNAFAKGPRGSGFLVTAPNGRIVLVTNAHVAGYSDRADVVFQSLSGPEKSYKNCPVLYADPNVDLAIIGFPPGTKGLATPLKFRAAPPQDGDDVWSAGYPGLLSSQSWQLARGNVTNQHLVESKLIDPARSYIIQHSAPIDPGSSGGPLLARMGKDSYEVVGVNTWTAVNRENANFAIPAATVERLLKAAVVYLKNRNKANYMRQLLETAANGFAQEVAKDAVDKSMGRDYIGYRFVSRAGWQSYQIALRNAKPDARDALQQQFFAVSPFKTMRGSLYKRIWGLIHPGGKGQVVTFDGIAAGADFTNTSGEVVTNYSVGAKKYTFSWCLENGHWRICNTNLFTTAPVEEAASSSSDTQGAQGTSPHSGAAFKVALGGGIGSVSLPSTSTGYSGSGVLDIDAMVSAQIPFNNYVMQVLGLRYLRTGYRVTETSSGSSITVMDNLIQGLIGWNLQFPFKVGSLTVVPGAGVGFGGSFSFGRSASGDTTAISSSSIFPFSLPVQVSGQVEVSTKKHPATFYGVEVVYERSIFGEQQIGFLFDNATMTGLLINLTFRKAF